MPTANLQFDERTLVQRLVQGDEEAFCELYAAYKNRLLYFAMRFLKSREYAEDVFQDAFAVVWQARRFLNPDASFAGYLYTIMKHRVLNELHKQAGEAGVREQLLQQAEAYCETADSGLHSAELRSLIAEALGRLTPRQREIFELSREAHLSHRQIAEQLNISVNTVHESISTSLRTLRAYLSRYCGSGTELLLCCFASGDFV